MTTPRRKSGPRPLGNSKLINTPKPLERMDSGDFSLHLRQASEQLLVLLVHEKLRWLQANFAVLELNSVTGDIVALAAGAGPSRAMWPTAADGVLSAYRRSSRPTARPWTRRVVPPGSAGPEDGGEMTHFSNADWDLPPSSSNS